MPTHGRACALVAKHAPQGVWHSKGLKGTRDHRRRRRLRLAHARRFGTIGGLLPTKAIDQLLLLGEART